MDEVSLKEKLLLETLLKDETKLVKDICIELGDISRFQYTQKLKAYGLVSRGKGKYKREGVSRSRSKLPQGPDLELLEYQLDGGGYLGPVKHWNLKRFPKDDRYFAYADQHIYLYEGGKKIQILVKDIYLPAVVREASIVGVSYNEGMFILIKK